MDLFMQILQSPAFSLSLLLIIIALAVIGLIFWPNSPPRPPRDIDMDYLIRAIRQYQKLFPQ